MSENILFMFSFRSFMVSYLIFRSLNYFEFIFVYGFREYSNFFYLHKPVQLSQHYLLKVYLFSMVSVQFSSVAQSCPTLCDPMNCNMPGLPVHHQIPEFTQIHVHRVSDAIQPSHPLSSSSPPAPYPSQHQSLFQ